MTFTNTAKRLLSDVQASKVENITRFVCVHKTDIMKYTMSSKFLAVNSRETYKSDIGAGRIMIKHEGRAFKSYKAAEERCSRKGSSYQAS